MSWTSNEFVVTALALLAFVTLGQVIQVLAIYRSVTISMHDRVRESTLLRRQYLERLEESQNS